MTDVRRVSPSEAKALVEQGYVYLDVRTEAEYAAGHPVGAQNVPFLLSGPGGMVPNPDFLAVMEGAYPKDARLVLGCRSGGRSLKAAHVLIEAGYADVIDQRAGYDGARDAFGQVAEKGWAPAGLPTEQETPGGSYTEIRQKV